MRKKRNSSYLFILLLTGYIPCRAQFDTSFAKSRIIVCADSFILGFRTHDWDLYTRYSYPALVGSMGGKEVFIDYMKQLTLQVPDTSWKRYQPGRVLQIVKNAGDLQAILELFTMLEWQGMRVTSTSHLICESWDGGMFWTFFDSQNDSIAARLINPGLHPSFKIPAKNEKLELINPAGDEKPPAIKSRNKKPVNSPGKTQ